MKLAFKEYFYNREESDGYKTEKSDYDYGSYIKCFCMGESKYMGYGSS
jgi:hypothetical protein